MFFLKKLFNKDKRPEPSENAKKIIEFLGCECECFPRSSSNQALITKYFEAHKSWRKGAKYFPVIIVVDDTLTEWLTEIISEGKTPQQLREEILSKSSLYRKEINTEGKSREQILEEARANACADGKKLIEELREMRREDMELDDESSYLNFTEEDVLRESFEGHAVRKFIGFCDCNDNSVKETILAYTPTTKPFEVFAWVPFGGWNECPCAEDMISLARYWYLKHNAVPAVISHDTLEFFCAPLDIKSAMETAVEHYAVCPDNVDQGIGTVAALADSLTKSTVWWFWWD